MKTEKVNFHVDHVDHVDLAKLTFSMTDASVRMVGSGQGDSESHRVDTSACPGGENFKLPVGMTTGTGTGTESLRRHCQWYRPQLPLAVKPQAVTWMVT